MNTQEQPSSVTRKRSKVAYIVLAFLYPLLHLLCQLIVQIVALFVFQGKALDQLGVGATQDELTALAGELLSAHANLISAISNAVAVVIVVLLALLINRAIGEGNLSVKQTLSLKPVKAYKLALAALMAVMFYHLVVLFLGVIGMIFPDFLENYQNASSNLSSDENVVVRFLALVIFAPLAEELVYRALSISNLKKAVPSFVAVLITAVVFGLAHGNLLWILYAAALGVVFGFLFTRTESIYTSLVAHVAFNLVGFIYSSINVEAMSETQATVYSLIVGLIAYVSLLLVPLLLFFLLRKPKNKTAPVSATSTQTASSAWVFDPQSGWYYDPQSGWYYSPQTGLYYHAQSRHYYNPATGRYYLTQAEAFADRNPNQ